MQGKRLSNWSGHDLATDVGTQRTLEELRLWKPRKVWWSPPCDPFSSLQNINQRTEEQVRKLKAKRRRGWRILRHIKWIIGQLQSEEADIEHYIEQPLRALSLREGPLVGLLPYEASFEGCRWDMVNTEGQSIKKSWRVLTTDTKFASRFSRRCRHAPGSHTTLTGGKNVSGSAAYPEKLCKEIAEHFADRPGWRQICDWMAPVNEAGGEAAQEDEDWMQQWAPFDDQEPAAPGADEEEPSPDEWPQGEEPDGEHLVPLNSQLARKVQAYIARLHDNLHHPPPERLARMLKRSGAHPQVVAAARSFRCDACKSVSRPIPRPRAADICNEPGKVGAWDGFEWQNPVDKQWYLCVIFVDEGSMHFYASCVVEQ